jgi:NAD(P)H dehydrogenase (quinone)
MSISPIVVTGVTGYVGRGVAEALSGNGYRLRLVARDPSRIPNHIEGERAAASYGDRGSMTSALAEASTLFLVSGREHPDRLDHHRGAVEAAAEAGIERIVYLSFLNAAPDATFTLARQHFHTEQFIRDTGASHVFLRDSLYCDSLPYFVGRDGVLRAPAGDGRVSLVVRDDIVEAAASVLADPSHDGATFDITGPEAVTLEEAVERLSRFVGRAITYEPQSEEDAYVSRSVYRAPDWEVEGWVSSYLAIAAGEMDTVSDAVERLTGHPPRSIEDFLATHPVSYRHLANS